MPRDRNRARARFNRWRYTTSLGQLFIKLTLEYAPISVRIQDERAVPGRRYVGGSSGKLFYLDI
jgi:hypothetical protein